MNVKTVAASLLAAAAFLMVPTASQAAPIYVEPGGLTGFYSTPDDVIATNGWAEANGGFRLSWSIIDPDISASGVWEYFYTITDVDGEPLSGLTHMLLEVSSAITTANVQSLLFDNNFPMVGPQVFSADPAAPGSTSPDANGGNPNLPADVYGVKLDSGQSTFAFKSPQAPVLGDFFAVGEGDSGGGVENGDGEVLVAYNSGIGVEPEVESPLAWIPVPDSESISEPGVVVASEPGTVALLGIGLFAFGALLWYKRRTASLLQAAQTSAQ